MQLIRGVNSAAALAALPMVTLTADALGEAVGAAAARRSLRGVRALLAHAREAGVAAGPEARDLWRAAIVAFGALGRPGEARRAFVDMRAAGAWELCDTPTVNLLLNALACDISVQFTRCAGCRHTPASAALHVLVAAAACGCVCTPCCAAGGRSLLTP